MSERTSSSTGRQNAQIDMREAGLDCCSPVLTRNANGDVQFNLTLFRSLELSRAGGSLLICVDLGVQASEVTPAHVRGEVRLVAPGIGAISAPVAAGQSCVAFAHHLHPDMASLLRAVILENPAECGVVVDLVCFDARPEPGWRLQANWPGIAAHLHANATDRSVTSEEIRALADEVVDAGHARLRFDPAWGEPGSVTSEGARIWLAELITARHFEPTLAPGGGSTPAFLCRPDGAQQQDSDVNGRIVERHVYGQASLEKMLATIGRPGEAFVHLLDLDDLFPAPFSVEIVCPALGQTVDTLQIDLDYGAAGRRSVSLHGPDQQARVTWPFDEQAGRSYRYSYRGTFSGSGAPFDSPVLASETANLLILPTPP